MKKKIRLTDAEVTSGLNRQKWAEGLIQQLPVSHDGRNNWLLNYGVSKEAIKLRESRGVKFNNRYDATETVVGATGDIVRRHGIRVVVEGGGGDGAIDASGAEGSGGDGTGQVTGQEATDNASDAAGIDGSIWHKYRYRAKTVEAVQFTYKYKDRVADSLKVRISYGLDLGFDLADRPIIKVKAIGGDIAIVRLGDWVVKEAKLGYYYPVKDEVFRAGLVEVS